ncbi:hypothetical protein ACFL07_11500 [Pseudomonadota bacterium]
MNRDDKTLDAQMDHLLNQLKIEKAPASLTRKLKQIPREHREKKPLLPWLFPGPLPKWVMAPAFAAVPLAFLVVVLMQPRQPSPQDIEQARQDLVVAFTYLDKAGLRTGNQIQSVLGGELRHNVKDKLSEHIPFTEQSLQEESS